MTSEELEPLPGDPFRRNYGTLTTMQKEDMDEIKRYYEIVWSRIRQLEANYGLSRDLSIARTELQNSCMWAVRAITKMEGQD